MSSATQYTLILIAYLAEHYNDEYISLKLVAENHRLSFAFLKQIALNLKNSGIVESKEGLKGGYRLALPPEKISMDTIVKSFKEFITPAACLRSHANCKLYCFCQLKNAWQNALLESLNKLSKKKLSEYVRAN
jgi:Rrf2 family nitric oxide-sensitive transcriptional repressor